MLSAQCSDNNVLHTAKNVMINPMENEPKTQIEEIKDFVPFVDMILVMTVEPGFGGQQFIECMADKICDLRNLYPDKDIQGWGENDRGVSFTFGTDIVGKFLNKHDLDLICRAHQVCHSSFIIMWM